MCIKLKTLFLFGVYLMLPITLLAEETDKNNPLTCYAKHLDTKEHVKVKTVSGIIKNKIATAQWPLGYPTIAIDNSAFLKLTKNVRRFIYYHECAHLKFETKDEHEADCKSLELINDNHGLSEIETRRLIKSLVDEFGMSIRWSDLTNCSVFPE